MHYPDFLRKWYVRALCVASLLMSVHASAAFLQPSNEHGWAPLVAIGVWHASAWVCLLRHKTYAGLAGFWLSLCGLVQYGFFLMDKL